MTSVYPWVIKWNYVTERERRPQLVFSSHTSFPRITHLTDLQWDLLLPHLLHCRSRRPGRHHHCIEGAIARFQSIQGIHGSTGN
jgi:hypothetical protein